MTVTLEKLGGDTRNSFIEKLKESFDAFVEENPGTPEGPVISRGAVSYTHLDVYKRQPARRAVPVPE